MSYTVDAKADIITSYLQSHKEYDSIIYSFKTNPSGTFLFDPTEDEKIMDFFIENPDEFPALVKLAVVSMISQYVGKDVLEVIKKELKVKLSNARQIKFKDWTSQYEGVPVAVECLVIGAYKEETYTKSAEVVCVNGHRFKIRNLNSLPKCQNISCTSNDVEIDPATIKTGDIRTVIIQEPMEEARFGTSRTLECIIKDDDVARTFIGQRKKIIGVFRSQSQKLKHTNRIMIHAISVHDLADRASLAPTDDQIHRFKQIAKSDGYIRLLTDSWAPEIKGESLAKLAVILARIHTEKMERIRTIMHVILIGNPGTGKTRILEYLPLVTEKCGFAVGGTASGSGITITMDRLPNGQKLPRVGIVVLCSGSCVALDELSQFDEEDLGKLYQAMESGKIPYHKAGFDMEPVAETAIMAGANPRNYRYDSSFGMVDNINLPEPLLSRFDMIVNMEGSKNITEEQEKIHHRGLMGKDGIDEYLRQNKLLTTDEMMVLLNYASSIFPKMTDEAQEVIEKFHLTMYELEKSEEQARGAKPIDMRFTDALYRIATKIAQLRFSDKITKEHALEAIEIQKKALQTFGLKTDKAVHQLSINSAVQDKETAFTFTWRKLEQENNTVWIDARVFLDRLIADYPNLWSRKKASDYFEKLHKQGDIQFQEGFYRLL